ncbi:MAG: DegT/DnrJ/EryC1/StrS family aminotransferase [Pseudomonadota bacterium]
MGSDVNFENRVKALTFARGRVALAVILRALDVREGDEVIIQAFTCIAVPEAIMAIGAKPIYADIEPDGFNIDPAAVESAITDRTRAIVIQHTFGLLADMAPITDIATRHKLPLIEDCCHSFLSKFRGEYVGTIGTAAFYSYEWGKPLICGVGGSAYTGDDKLAKAIANIRSEFAESSVLQDMQLALQYRVFSILYQPALFWWLRDTFRLLSRFKLAKGNYSPLSANDVSPDFSMRMARTSQKILDRKFAYIHEYAARSREITASYSERINSKQVTHPQPLADTEAVYARYPLRVVDKDALLDKARTARLEMANWYVSPIHPLEKSEWEKASYTPGQCPNAEQRCREIVSLPVNNKVDDRYVDAIANLFANSL